MKLGWLSDIHLDHASPGVRQSFLTMLRATPVDGWLISGDIGQAGSVAGFLIDLEAAVSTNVYFTLGNHDFYGGSFARARRDVSDLVQRSSRLVWLTDSEPVTLGDGITVVGDDTWADARYGTPLTSGVEVNDFYLIAELTGLSRAGRIAALNRLGDECAARLRPKLVATARASRRVILLVHVPPFREAAWHEGRISSDEWLPWFSCRAVGDTILATAEKYRDCQFLVLCGHTHSSGTCVPAPNVKVLTASAEYGSPGLQAVIEIDDGEFIVGGGTR